MKFPATAPTAEECSANSKIEWDGHQCFAAWYPQMGGYTSPCLIIPWEGGCFDVFVWHDGEFPFGEEDDVRGPVRQLHHCDAEQFIRFGTLVLARSKP